MAHSNNDVRVAGHNHALIRADMGVEMDDVTCASRYRLGGHGSRVCPDAAESVSLQGASPHAEDRATVVAEREALPFQASRRHDMLATDAHRVVANRTVDRPAGREFIKVVHRPSPAHSLVQDGDTLAVLEELVVVRHGDDLAMPAMPGAHRVDTVHGSVQVVAVRRQQRRRCRRRHYASRRTLTILTTGDRTTTVAGPHTLHTMWAVFMQITTSLAVIVSVTVYSRRTPACVCYLITQRQTGVEVRALLPDMARLCAADQLI